MAGHAIFFTPTTLNACRRLPHFVRLRACSLCLAKMTWLRMNASKTFLRPCGSKQQSRLPHEEVFRGCTIIGIFFDSCIAKRDKQIDMRCCLSEASSSNDYDNITSGLRAQDVFAPFFVSFLSVMKEMKAPCRVKPCIKKYLLDVFFGGLEKKPYLCRLNVLVC